MKQFALITILLAMLFTACKKEKKVSPPPPAPAQEQQKWEYPVIDHVNIRLARPLKQDTMDNFFSLLEMSERVQVGTTLYPKYEEQQRGYYKYTSDTTIERFSLLYYPNYIDMPLEYVTSWNNAGALRIRTKSFNLGFITSISNRYCYKYSVKRESDLIIDIDYGGNEILPVAFVVSQFLKILNGSIGMEDRKIDLHYLTQ